MDKIKNNVSGKFMYPTRLLLRNGAFLVFTLTVSGCAYLLPDNTSAPRFNGVLGERHVPQLNRQAGQQGSQNNVPSPSMSPDAQEVAAAPIPAVTMNNLPPVDDATKARAEQVMADSTPAAPAGLPAATIASSQGRRVPVENMAGMQMAANDYPALSSVPPRPVITGEDSAAAHLAKVRSSLEQDRANAETAKEKLARDAASEPSMLSDTPPTDAVVPPPAPVSVSPVAPLAPASIPALSPAPQSSIAPNTTIAMPPSPIFAPPPPPFSTGALPPVEVSSIPAPRPVPIQQASVTPVPVVALAPAAPVAAPAPAIVYTPAPITLRPPVETAAVKPAPVFQPTAPAWPEPQAAAPAASGGFDPMAGGAVTASNQATVYAGAGYLPSSRYSYQR